jgi:hypothetical protein
MRIQSAILLEKQINVLNQTRKTATCPEFKKLWKQKIKILKARSNNGSTKISHV